MKKIITIVVMLFFLGDFNCFAQRGDAGKAGPFASMNSYRGKRELRHELRIMRNARHHQASIIHLGYKKAKHSLGGKLKKKKHHNRRKYYDIPINQRRS
jgi:hypothetical protein